MAAQTLRSSTPPHVRRRFALEAHELTASRRPLAADLHLHSRHASGVSSAMTLENIAAWAQRKGLDLLGTGDCLQPEWLNEIATKLVETESGFLQPHADLAAACAQTLPAHLHRPLQFVLSTEVCCAPPGTPDFGGLHHLLYFPSLDRVRRLQSRLARFGDLREGRPTLTLTSKQLLDVVLEHGDGCALAPAHVLNPWYSTLGSASGGSSLHEVFGELASRVLAIEMGLPATPPMCRRISALDGHALYSCSDAHSLPKIGREYTLFNIEPNYAALLQALRYPDARHISGFVKMPVERTRYYRNHCGVCQRSFDDTTCPRCGLPLAIGSRDRLQRIASRPTPPHVAGQPSVQQLLPLRSIIAEVIGVEVESAGVSDHYERLIRALGNERYILTTAPRDEITAASVPQLARAIVAQRVSPLAPPAEDDDDEDGEQLSLDF